jgi:hypothetical protein
MTPCHEPLESESPPSSPPCPASATFVSPVEAMDIDTADSNVFVTSSSNAGGCFESLWPLARCNGRSKPLSDAEYFNATAKSAHGFQPIDIPSMKYWETFPEPSEPAQGRLGNTFVEVVPLRQEARDNLLAAITPLKLEANKSAGSAGVKALGVRDCLALPQTRLLDYFIRLSTARFAGYFSLFPRGLLNPSELVLHDCRLKALLTLLMVLCGACSVQHPRVRRFVEILEEACRLQSMSIMSRPATIAGDTAALHACLASTIHGAWSGHKQLMEAALMARTSCIEVRAPRNTESVAKRN